MTISTGALIFGYVGGIVGAWLHVPSVIIISTIPFFLILGVEIGKELKSSTPTGKQV